MTQRTGRLAAASLSPLLLAIAVGARAAAAAAPEPGARAIRERLSSPRGICAMVGEGAVEVASRLARSSDWTFLVQLPDAKEVERARRALEGAGLLNRRVYVERGDGSHLSLATNLADLVVVRGAAEARVPRQEVLRVLRPGGEGLIGSTSAPKPMAKGVDDWSHPYHGPDNNPLSSDRVARAPYLTQFLAEPWYCPMPELTVAAGGRVFKAFGSRAFRRPQWPVLNTLIALNGYNGVALWTRKLDPDFMIHRNTLIATADTLYLGDAASCKLLDAATGRLKGEIKVPRGFGDGPVWKWMALEGNTLYALVGEKEPPGDRLKGPAYRGAGWPWWPIPQYRWGFGRTILAFDLATRKVRWRHHEEEPLDTRAMCMKNGRVYFYGLKKFLGCLDARSGRPLWKTTDPAVVNAIANQRAAQRAVWGFAASAYAKCGDDALYFAGPQQTRLLAVSSRDGKLLWEYPQEGNFQLVIRPEALYAMGSNHQSLKLDLLTGKVLQRLPNRAACTRATGSTDRVFVRGRGTRCWDVASGKWLHISPMRPACHDGVVIAGGQLYWGPWMCGCNLSLIGVVCAGPAGGFDHAARAREAERLSRPPGAPSAVAPLPVAAADWPTYRKDNARRAWSPQAIPAKVVLRWTFKPPAPATPTAPVAVGSLALVGGSDGVVRALDASDGRPRWTAWTGGGIVYPPSVADGRALVGSADGWVYALEATSGRLLWRFRAAPIERTIPVYGSLSSTWPVASGVLVADGVAYAAAGIASYDGTHVYALDAATGSLRWQNNTSGGTAGGQGAGVSVHGHLLLDGGKLYMPGGNTVPVASYGVADGRFQPLRPPRFGRDRRGPRGKELFLRRDGSVVVSGSLPFHCRPEDFHFIEQAELAGPSGTVSLDTQSVTFLRPSQAPAGRGGQAWSARPFPENVAAAVGRNAVVVAGTSRRFDKPDAPPAETHGIAALRLEDGRPLWRLPLPAAPVAWGIAIDREGRVLVALRDGRVACFGPP